MQYKPLGRSGLLVSELSLGTMTFGDQKARYTQPEEATRMIHQYLDHGGNHLDTADGYTGGRAEEIVGQAIADRRDEVILASKVRFPQGELPTHRGLSRLHIVRAVEGSLRRLNTAHIDLLYMHAWDHLTPIEESLRACDDLVSAGKVRYIGSSNFRAWQLMKALCTSDADGLVRFIVGQYQYSLLVRDIEREIVELCQSEDVGIAAWAPLGGGFLTGKYTPTNPPQSESAGRLAHASELSEDAWPKRATEENWKIVEAVQEIAQAHGCTAPQVALAWLLARPGVSTVLIGARTMEQFEDNLGGLDLELSEDDMARLNRVSAIDPGYPGRFIQVLKDFDESRFA